MATHKATSWAGHPCPTGGEAHGPLLAIRGVDGWMCVHADHNGRPKSHPDGAAPETRRVFTMAEIEKGVAV